MARNPVGKAGKVVREALPPTDESYYHPGAVWGTIAGSVVIIKPALRPHWYVVLVRETGQVTELILSEKHSSAILPGYSDLKELPRDLWPRVERSDRRAVPEKRVIDTATFLRHRAKDLRGALRNSAELGDILFRRAVLSAVKSIEVRAKMIENREVP